MIKSIRSKALKLLWTKGDSSKLPVPNVGRVERQLATLDAAVKPEDMDLPGNRFHPLKGKPQRYAVDSSANFRLTYGWEATDAIDVDLEDYH